MGVKSAEALAREIVAALGPTHKPDDPPTVHEITSRWLEGEWNEDAPGWLQLCRIVAPDPVAEWLYVFHLVGPSGLYRGKGLSTLQDWCAGIAAEGAFTGRRWRRERMAAYRRRWARQAGRDGAALAMWGAEVRDVLPGVNKRAQQYGVRIEDYLTIRDYAEHEAFDLLADFKADMVQAHSGKFDGYFRKRYALAMGREMPA